VAEKYGFGLSLGDGWFGHGGAYATNMRVDTRRGLVEVFLVQHAGFRADGSQSQGAFIRAAEKVYGH
jgi:CubicO group peptidase (beta-lactamase class C family)